MSGSPAEKDFDDIMLPLRRLDDQTWCLYESTVRLITNNSIQCFDIGKDPDNYSDVKKDLRRIEWPLELSVLQDGFWLGVLS